MQGEPFDPLPFILLNLVLSFQAGTPGRFVKAGYGEPLGNNQDRNGRVFNQVG